MELLKSRATLYSDENIYDFKFINQTMLYTTNNSIKIYNQNLNKSLIISSDYIVMKIINSGQDYLFAINDKGKLYKIKKEGGNNDWELIELNTDEKNGIITDVLQIDQNKWYYSTYSENILEKMIRGE